MSILDDLAPNQRERFWSRVDRTGTCWKWQGPPNSNGYGQISINRKTYIAHRLAYLLTHGPVSPGMVLRHTCDNRLCVNPDHLIPGTLQENVSDAVQRRRMGPGRNAARGERAGSSRLTERDVLAIRAAYVAGGVTQITLARDYGVDNATISRILTGKAWTHLPTSLTSQSSEPRKPEAPTAHKAIPLPGFAETMQDKGGAL